MSDAAQPVPAPGAQPPHRKGAGAVERAPLRRGLMARLLSDTMRRWGARIGMAWVAILVLCAVFAPFLASSHPLLWSREGRVASPLLEHLTTIDVMLLIALFTGVALSLLRRAAPAARIAAWLWILLATLPFAAHAEAWRWLGRSDHNRGLSWALVIAAVALIVLCLVLIPLLVRSSLRLRIGVGAAAALLAGLLLVFPVLPPRDQVLSRYREAAGLGEVQWARMAPIPYSPNDRQRDRLAREGVDPRLLPPGTAHVMGTTDEGADLLSRMIHASRIALAIGLIATAIAVSIGIVIGGVMGYFSGWVDLVGMRLVEIFSAIPVIFLLIMIVAFYGRSLYLMMVIIGLTGWVGYALFIRAEFLKLRSMDYVQAARAVGAPLWSILFRHMLPNGITPVLVLASFGIASAILTESTLSFLGLGLVEEPSWGQMLNQARAAGSHWGLVIYPGLAIFLTVFAYNLIGEALRDAIDPHSDRAGHV